MEKGKIRKLKKEIPAELAAIEDFFINDAEENFEQHYATYRLMDSSVHGKYVCSDLFKETFPLYTESIDSRKRYSEIVHNSAACLAGEYFDRLASDPSIKKCIFLSGVPGAGKSYLIQSIALSGELDDSTMVYEGDITTPTIYEKLDKCVENGIEIYFLVVNPTLELAQRNAIARHFEIGRGASCETMARIMSKIPNAIREISQKYDIELGIYNKTTNYEITPIVGMEYIESLEHGTYEEILVTLQQLRDVILEEYKKKTELNETPNNGEGQNNDDENGMNRDGEGNGKGRK